ncbi:acyl-CoA dehydrogenase family protein [Terricaulis silvestris]|uniref:Acyl-CoA dehydrogenase n=1 Tax=Terricaulis silvestris TaxID=2686094 RepID=A0A6I6MND3_9CAUL|nr:acyl-CoA dehydrogenase family protein [Terricaulis silvestris]QGZ96199.1 Acyl-CoA dehydrogenase [Terricaulis silvestris]
MDFTYSDEQQSLQDSVKRFCEREYSFEKRQALLKTEDGFDRANWATFAELGWLGAAVAEDAGGFGGGPIENAIILEQLARGLSVAPFLSSAVIATQAIAQLASGAQREALLTPLIGGERIAALAHGETAQHAFAPDIETKAAASGGGYRLTGRKTFVLGGQAADLFLVSATTGGGGVSLFAVPAEAKGLERVNYHAVDGRRVSDITLKDVEVPADALIGDEGEAQDAIDYALDYGVIGLCAEAVGAMDAALWITRDYLKTRKQFGVSLNTFQALQHRMADMLVETELARSMLYRGIAALSLDNKRARARGVSAAKAQIGEAGFFVGGQAVQLHGGIGVTEEYIVGHYFKRLALVRGLYGSSDQHLTRFAESAEGQNEEELSPI